MERYGDFISKQLVKYIFNILYLPLPTIKSYNFGKYLKMFFESILVHPIYTTIDMFIIVPKLATNCEFRVSIPNPHFSLDEFFVVHSSTLFPRIVHYHGGKKYSCLERLGLSVNIWLENSPFFIFFHSFDLYINCTDSEVENNLSFSNVLSTWQLVLHGF